MAVFEYDRAIEELLDAGEFDFEWDRGNRTKNWVRHAVNTDECEEVFFAGALPLGVQTDPPVGEVRYAVLGETFARRLLFVAFTLRGAKIRVVSAREMTQSEREDYGLLR